jgi:molecular chaperone DnaK (HSP70)
MSLLTAQRSSEWIGCIDFGTALSKVAMVRRKPRSQLSHRDAIPLAVGAREGGGARNPLLLPSIVYITDDERILFGDGAQMPAGRGEWLGRQAFTSPKQYLSTHELRELEEPLEASIDPTGKYTPRDLLTLFLAHLLAQAGASAAASRLPWPVPLRIARPAWEPGRAAAAEEILRSLLLQGFAIADDLGSKLTAPGGVADRDALIALSKAQHDSRLRNPADFKHVFELNGQGSACVLEATAAAAGSIRDAGRRVVAVADIGGGTSDFGAFLTGLPGHDVLAEIRGSSHILREAGDHLDMLLTRYILEKAGMTAEDPGAKRAAQQLRRDQRANKEKLFAAGELLVRLGDDVERVTLEAFLADPRVAAFAQSLRSKFHDALTAAVDCARQYSQPDHGARIPVEILLTGGGHALPMVRELASYPSVEWLYADAAPEIPDGPVSEDFSIVRRQLAVAIGGAVRDLPRMTALFGLAS